MKLSSSFQLQNLVLKFVFIFSLISSVFGQKKDANLLFNTKPINNASLQCIPKPQECNLVLNGDFEQNIQVPDDVSQINRACGWNSTNGATPDYFHVDSENYYSQVPCNLLGYENDNVVGNNAYVGFGNFSDETTGSIWVESFFSQLLSPLQPNTTYSLKLDVSVAEAYSWFNVPVQVYFAHNTSTFSDEGYINNISNPNTLFTRFVAQYDGWITLNIEFTTDDIAGEEIIIIGTIAPEINERLDNPAEYGLNECNSTIDDAGYYAYVDNIKLTLLPNKLKVEDQQYCLMPLIHCPPQPFVITGESIQEGATINWYINEVDDNPIYSGIYPFQPSIPNEPGVYQFWVAQEVCGAEGPRVLITVEILPTPSFTLTASNPCANQNDGSITVNVEQTLGLTYTYNIASSTINLTSTDNVFLNLPPDVYTISVVSSNGCVKNEQITLVSIENPTFNLPTIVCQGDILNLPTVSSNGISGTWSPSNVVNTTNAGVTPIYSFTPSNNNQCSENFTIKFTVKIQLEVSVSVVNATCDNNNGSIEAIVTYGPLAGPNNPYTYWLAVSDENIISSTNGVFNNLAPGTYELTISHPNACDFVQEVTVLDGEFITPHFKPIAPDCAEVPFVLPSLSYGDHISGTWSPAPNFNTTTTYTFTPDPGQCATQTTITVIRVPWEIPMFPFDGLLSPQPLGVYLTICEGDPVFDLPTVSLGSPGLGGGIPGVWTPSELDNTHIGTVTYNFHPSDEPGCSAMRRIVLTVKPKLEVSVNVVNATCSNSNGSIEATVTYGPLAGPNNPYSYCLVISDENVVCSPNGNFTNLAPGTYELTVSHPDACISYTQLITVEVDEYNPSIIPFVVDACSPTSNNGTISVTTSGAPGPFTFTLYNSNGGTVGPSNITGIFNNVATGNYTIQAVSSNGCSVLQSVTVGAQNPTPNSTIGFHAGVASPGSTSFDNAQWVTGSICPGEEVVLLSYFADFNFNGLSVIWYNNQQGSGTPVGVATVFDNSGNAGLLVSPQQTTTYYGFVYNPITGCMSGIDVAHNVLTVEVEEYKPDVHIINNCETSTVLVTNATENAIITFYSEDGIIIQQSSDGHIEGVTDGNYYVTVDNPNSCDGTAYFTITNTHITADISVNCDGLVTVSNVTGGTPTYHYSWSFNGVPYYDNETNTFQVPEQGSGFVTIEDKNKCTKTLEFEFKKLKVKFTTSNDCDNPRYGIITAHVIGGTPEYHYQWQNSHGNNVGTDSNILQPVRSGTYALTVTDANGCQITQNVSFEYIPPTPVYVTGNDIVCPAVTGNDMNSGYTFLTFTGYIANVVFSTPNAGVILHPSGSGMSVGVANITEAVTTIIYSYDDLITGCRMTREFYIYIPQSPAFENSVVSICKGGQFILPLNETHLLTSSEPNQHVWTNHWFDSNGNFIGDGTSLINVYSNSTYYCYPYIEELGCYGLPATITFNVLDCRESPVTIYPNPATDFVILDAETEVRNVVIYDFVGNKYELKVIDSKENKYDTSNFSDGIYIIQYTLDSGEAQTQELIIKR